MCNFIDPRKSVEKHDRERLRQQIDERDVLLNKASMEGECETRCNSKLFIEKGDYSCFITRIQNARFYFIQQLYLD